MTSYTVLNRHGEVQERNCGLHEAAETVLRYDGYEFEIRPEEDGRGYRLWTSTFSRNSGCFNGLTRSVIFSLEDHPAHAVQDIYRQVINHSDWWCGCDVMSDDDYDAMQAEAAREAE